MERVALSNRTRKRRGVVQFPWELAESSELGLKSLASTSIDARFINRDIDGQIHCRLLPISGSRCCRQLVHYVWCVGTRGTLGVHCPCVGHVVYVEDVWYTN
ncbi:hypothetical protein Taro_001310 [Colocasia esculenta]|uniref:Uncharacterized protein n=1 Tax=Colocasia esculenta TaxID=4460 RepID=A0A843THI6_COLES|nr:hypothetical protein [Colocasia esculenta]